MKMPTEKKYTAKPTELPEPTYWPFFSALGVVFMFWGILTTWVITGIGLVVFAIALSGWITDLYKEISKDKEK